MLTEFSNLGSSSSIPILQSEPACSSSEPARRSFLDAAQIKYQQTRVFHWNEIARKLETWTGWGGYYHRRLTQLYQSLVSPGQSVLEFGCSRGDLLAALNPASGVGVDFSEEMIR